MPYSLSSLAGLDLLCVRGPSHQWLGYSQQTPVDVPRDDGRSDASEHPIFHETVAFVFIRSHCLDNAWA